MVWLIVIVAIAVLGIGAMVAGGAFGSMPSDPVRDEFEPTLPPTRLTGADLDDVRFQVQLRGYDMATVDALLQRLSREVDQRDAELAELRDLASSRPGSTEFGPEAAPDAE